MEAIMQRPDRVQSMYFKFIETLLFIFLSYDLDLFFGLELAWYIFVPEAVFLDPNHQ